MRRFVARSKSGKIYPVMGTLMARYTYRSAKSRIGFWLILSSFFFFISPALFFASIMHALFIYHREIYERFFIESEMKAKYTEILKPMTDGEIYSNIGYRVFAEELNEHIALVSSNSSENLKALGKKGERMRGRLASQFGLDITTILTHVALIGTTGAGKTSLLISLFHDVILGGGGLTLIDGKGDQPIEQKLYSLCAENYYETQFYAIVLNFPENSPDSNTYSPLLSFTSPIKTSEFLGSFLGGGGEGGGNHEYFMNRGKVMLGNIVAHYKNRQLFYGENFSIQDLEISIKPAEMNNIYYIGFGILKDIEALILEKAEDNLSFKSLLLKAHSYKVPQLEEFKNTEVLYTYIQQNSHLSRSIETILGIKWTFVAGYYELFSSLSAYMSGISSEWEKGAQDVARVIHLVIKEDGGMFIYGEADVVSSPNIRSVYTYLKDEGSKESLAAEKLVGSGMVSKTEFDGFMSGIGRGDGPGVESINTDALQQHNYADQQWSRLFGLFREYSRVLGSPFPDIDGEDIVRNGKVLYVMLPALSASPDQLGMLGLMFILMFKTNASQAVGGDKQSILPLQFKIYQNLIKPNPIHLIVADEIGSYVPEQGLSILLSQIRSLRMGMILSAQDVVSMKAGTGERELKRIMANLSKIILKNRDQDTKEIGALLPEIEVIDSDVQLHSAINEGVLESGNITLKKEPSVEIGITTKFAMGLGLYIDGQRDEPVFFQSYWQDDQTDRPLQIRRFAPYDEAV